MNSLKDMNISIFSDLYYFLNIIVQSMYLFLELLVGDALIMGNFLSMQLFVDKFILILEFGHKHLQIKGETRKKLSQNLSLLHSKWHTDHKKKKKNIGNQKHCNVYNWNIK